MLLPDVNVWVAATFDTHQHHASVKVWWDGLTDEPIAFTRMTQQGFLRLATSNRIVGPQALTLQQAWLKYDFYLSYPQITFVVEPIGVESRWRNMSDIPACSPKMVNDAYLAGFAVAGGYELVTFDQGFKQYPGLNCTILT